MCKKLISTAIVSALVSRGAIVMASSSALLSQSMTISVGDAASPEVFAAIPEVKTIDGPSGQAPEIDVTDLTSTAREFVLGLEDEGEITLEVNYIPKNVRHAALRADKNSGTARNYRITFTDSPATTWTFSAIVKGLTISNAVDSTTTASIALRLTGSITEA